MLGLKLNHVSKSAPWNESGVHYIAKIPVMLLSLYQYLYSSH